MNMLNICFRDFTVYCNEKLIAVIAGFPYSEFSF